MLLLFPITKSNLEKLDKMAIFIVEKAISRHVFSHICGPCYILLKFSGFVDFMPEVYKLTYWMKNGVKPIKSCHAVPFPNKRSTRQQRCCQYQLSIFRKKQPKNKSLSQSNVNSQSLDPCSRLPSQGWTCSFPPSWSWLSPWTFASTKSCRKTSGSRPSSRNTKTSTDRHVCRPWNYGKNMSNT